MYTDAEFDALQEDNYRDSPLFDSFHTELEPEEYKRRQHGAVKVTRKALDDYACTVCIGADK